MVEGFDNFENAELWFSKDADPNGGSSHEKKYRRIQGYGRDILFSKKLFFVSVFVNVMDIWTKVSAQ